MVQDLAELLDVIQANTHHSGDKDAAFTLSRLVVELRQSEPNLYACRKVIALHAAKLGRRVGMAYVEDATKLHYLAAATLENQAQWEQTAHCEVCYGYGLVPGPKGTICGCPSCGGPAICGRPYHSEDVLQDPLAEMLMHVGRGVPYQLLTPDGSKVPVLYMGLAEEDATQAWTGVDKEGRVVACGCWGKTPCGTPQGWEWGHALTTSFDLLNGFKIVSPP